MGFGNVVSTMILFIAVLTLATSAAIVFKNIFDETSSAMQIQSDSLTNKLKTDVTILDATYNNVTDVLSLSIRNTGKTVVKPGFTDVFVDGGYVPRNDSNRTITLESSTDVSDVGLWNPNEVVTIVVDKNLETGTHTVSVAAQYGATAETTFSVQNG
ncbi:MAG: hypothetical protein H6502_02665 [Candidatus Woesearchaeota archaeon]|nr:MAG: hypothetical protein H6502_02665 [Candidatus Woesearchaeota archaeon]